MSRRCRIALIGALALALLVIAAGFAFAPLVRSAAKQRAARLGFDVQIDAVRPAWLGVRLRGVTVSSPQLAAVTAKLDSLEVRRGRLDVQGGMIALDQPMDVVRRQVKAWKNSRPSGSSDVSSGGGWQVSVRDVGLTWPGVFGEHSSVVVSGLGVSGSSDLREISLANGQLVHPGAVVSASGVTLQFVRGARLGPVEVEHLRAEIMAPKSVNQGPSPGSTNTKLQVSAQVAQAPAGSASANAAQNKAQPASPNTLSAGLRLTALRDRAVRLAQKIAAPMGPNGSLTIEAFELKLTRGEQVLQLGPGRLLVTPEPNALQVQLQPSSQEGGDGITFRGMIARGAGPVEFDVVGGPIPLSALGIHEGNLGLVNVKEGILTADGHVKLDAQGKTLSIDGTFGAKNIGVFDKRLARDKVLGLQLAAKLRAQTALDGSKVNIEQAQIELGKIQFFVSGTIERTPNDQMSMVDQKAGAPKVPEQGANHLARDKKRRDLRMDLKFELGLVSCQGLLDSLPSTLVPVVHGMGASGTISLKGVMKYDDVRPQDFVLQYNSHNDCRVTSVPEHLDVRKFLQPFRLRTYDPNGNVSYVDTGPGTPSWVEHGAIAEVMEAAIMTCEDRGFRYHNGFDREAIRNSMRMNLQARSFVRGASTVPMQLAKNLYLSREKTVARKLQELILTTYLVQELSKNQILELYLNVIEFGPMTYGIGPAAAYYFNTLPIDLSVTQAMYLASILPSPNRSHFREDGKLSDGWMRYLYKLVQAAEKNGWITSEQALAGRSEWLIKGQAQPETTVVQTIVETTCPDGVGDCPPQ